MDRVKSTLLWHLRLQLQLHLGLGLGINSCNTHPWVKSRLDYRGNKTRIIRVRSFPKLKNKRINSCKTHPWVLSYWRNRIRIIRVWSFLSVQELLDRSQKMRAVSILGVRVSLSSLNPMIRWSMMELTFKVCFLKSNLRTRPEEKVKSQITSSSPLISI